MKTQKLNILIVHSNKPMVNALRQKLNTNFGKSIEIANAYDVKSCLEKLNNETHIVILGSFSTEQNYTDLVNSMKIINPDIEIIPLSDNQSICLSIEHLRKNTSDRIAKVGGIWRQTLQAIQKAFNVLFGELGRKPEIQKKSIEYQRTS